MFSSTSLPLERQIAVSAPGYAIVHPPFEVMWAGINQADADVLGIELTTEGVPIAPPLPPSPIFRTNRNRLPRIERPSYAPRVLETIRVSRREVVESGFAFAPFSFGPLRKSYNINRSKRHRWLTTFQQYVNQASDEFIAYSKRYADVTLRPTIEGDDVGEYETYLQRFIAIYSIIDEDFIPYNASEHVRLAFVLGIDLTPFESINDF